MISIIIMPCFCGYTRHEGGDICHYPVHGGLGATISLSIENGLTR
jgi:hypothetical protein